MYGLSIVDGAKRVCRGFKNDQFKQKFTLKKSKNFKSIKSKIRFDTIVQPIARIIFMYGMSQQMAPNEFAVDLKMIV